MQWSQKDSTGLPSNLWLFCLFNVASNSQDMRVCTLSLILWKLYPEVKMVDNTLIFWILFTASFQKLFWNPLFATRDILSWLKLDTVSQFLLCFSCSSQTLISAGSEFTWVFWGQSSTLITCQDTDKTVLNLQDDWHLHSSSDSIWCGPSEHLWDAKDQMHSQLRFSHFYYKLQKTGSSCLVRTTDERSHTIWSYLNFET